jgi:arginine/ornithine transport system substrate-binding protein
MQRLRRASLTVLVLAVITVPVLAQTGADAKRLRLGVEGAYPPFSEVGPDGRLKGFDIDMALALCERIGVQCTLVQQEWDGMIPALNARKFDAIIASMAITEERQRQVAFSAPYYSTPVRWIARLGSLPGVAPAQLKGKRIGVQRSSIHDRYVTQMVPGAEVVRYARQDDVYLDLAAGRVDLVLGDSVAADLGFLKRPAGKGFGFVGAAVEHPIFGQGAGIAVRKADAALAERFSAAIRAMRADGSYQKIQSRYFDFDIYGGKP